MNDIQFKKNYSVLVSPVYPQQTQSAAKSTKQQEVSFKQMFGENIRKSEPTLTFSKHAMQRLDDRRIEVSPQLVAKMTSAVEKAEDKGVTEALFLDGTTAFIVNIPNRTVVTTMNGGEMKENVFTNIDGAVIL